MDVIELRFITSCTFRKEYKPEFTTTKLHAANKSCQI